MMDFIKAHYAKLIAFLAGWAAEALIGISDFLKSFAG